MPEISQSRYLVQAGWDDVPHLDEQTKAELLDSIPPYQRASRTKGTPSLGSGAIYPIPPEEFTVAPFQMPAYWPRAYGLDVGWNRTAAIWGALDRDNDCWYLYTQHYMGQAIPTIHATAIRARGAWIPGLIDPAARGRNQKDGEQLLANYIALGLILNPANNSVEAGIYEVWDRIQTGRLKVFSTCMDWFAEYRLYRRDEKGHIVKKMDHLMDATRYLIVLGSQFATTQPIPRGKATFGRERPADTTAGY